MSDSTQQYILKKPVTINEVREQGKSLEWNVYMPCGDVQVYNDESDVFNDFVPLDIPAIEKQLEEILYGTLGVNINGDEISEKVMAKKIVARLFGLENKETEQ